MQSIASRSSQHNQLQSSSSTSRSTPGAPGTPSTSVPSPNHTGGTPFALDAFDFSSPDFVLPNNMDELNIFANQNQSSSSNNNSNRFEAADSPRNHHQQAAHSDSPSHQNLNPDTRFDDLSSHQIQAMIQSAAASVASTANPSSSSSPSNSSSPRREAQKQQLPQSPSAKSPSSHNLNVSFNSAPIGNGSNPSLTIQDLHRILIEKEQSERMQNMQTAVLRQQLETLQQMSKQQSEQALMAQNNFSNQNLHQQPSQPFLPFYSQGSRGPQSSNSTPAGTHHSSPNHSYPNLPNISHSNSKNSPSSSSSSNYQTSGPSHSNAAPANVIAQYGLMTPMGSGGFNGAIYNHHPNGNHQQPYVSPLDMPHSHGHEMDDGHQAHQQRWRQDNESAFSPLESPAMTPASVFSNMSRGGGAENLFFSPLTSPALRPQPPSAGEMLLAQHSQYQLDGSHMQHHHGAYDAPLQSPQFRGQGGQSTTPAASPLALMGKPGPSSGSGARRNRSSTAEAKANKIRPSPLVKPQGGRGKKRDSSGITSPRDTTMTQSTSDSRRPSFGEGSEHSRSRSGSRAAQQQPQTSISAFASTFDSNTRMDASPSEGAASTPSPIDLSGSMMMPPPTAPSNKPMTPGSIMGIRSGSGSRQSSNLAPSKSNSEPSVPSATRSTRAKSSVPSMNGTSNSTTGVQPILKKPAIYTGGPAGPRAQAGGGRGKRAVKAAAVNFANPGMTPEEREVWLNKMAGTDGDSRKTSHKAAEQKRRDSLKYCFDELRTLLPAILLDESSPGGSALGADGAEEDTQAEKFEMADTLDKVPGSEAAKTANKGISKVALLRHSNEYIIRLKMRLNRRDEELEKYREEVRSLKRELGRPEDSDEELQEDGHGDDEDEDHDGLGGIDHPMDLGFGMDTS